jgi:hypothetical protein
MIISLINMARNRVSASLLVLTCVKAAESNAFLKTLVIRASETLCISIVAKAGFDGFKAGLRWVTLPPCRSLLDERAV